ncbi:MFS transporter [Mesobaculum littorinae]|uniref:MFS transporter n=1 Tax=Mesobaculum littorinae TaxID=2486419 RepID=A0A438AEZ9_9RHOB|nr:MFS transporter [Mesobaculum littorinae]RVV97264.1 MFS transporter [Mesobaculum littorinae]
MSLLTTLRLIGPAACAFVVLGGGWGIFAASVPDLKGAIGAGDGDFGLAVLCSSSGLLAAMWLAPQSDRRLGAMAVPVTATLFACALLLPAMADRVTHFALAMIPVGLCSGLLDVSMNARVSEAEARAGRPLMNLAHALYSLSYAVAAVATGWAREADWPPVALFAILLALVLVGVRRMVVPVAPVPDAANATRQGFPVLLVTLAGATVLFGFMAENAVEGWSALHLERTLGGGAAEGALGPAMLGLTMGVGRVAGQVFSERFATHKVLTAGALVAAAGIAAAAAAPGLAVAYAGFAVFGLGVSVVVPLALAMVGAEVSPAHRTRAISRTAVVGFFGIVFGPPLMGGVSEVAGLRAAFGAQVLLLLAVPLCLVAFRRAAARRGAAHSSDGNPA